MSDLSSVLFVSRNYRPELIGSAPFSTDIAEWLAAHGRPTTVVSGLPHYPHDDVFPAYRDAADRLAQALPVAVGGKDIVMRVVRQAAHHRGRPAVRGQPFGDVGAEGRRADQLRPVVALSLIHI